MRTILCGVIMLAVFAGGAWGAEGKGVTAVTLVKSTTSWDGSILPLYPAGTPEISILKITVLPGARLPSHLHQVINAAYVLEGELTVVTRDNKIKHLRAGDPLVEVVNTLHYGKNDGPAPVELIVFYAGIQGQAITVNEK